MTYLEKTQLREIPHLSTYDLACRWSDLMDAIFAARCHEINGKTYNESVYQLNLRLEKAMRKELKDRSHKGETENNEK
jgi:hypothetical protein